MRYRYYTDARHADGTVAAGHTIAVYTNLAGTTSATLYAAATGATTVDNPLTVPSTGIVDFWCDLSTLYTVSQGEVTVRPLYPANETSPVNVRDFGATGDGATDDTAAFQAAIDYIASFGHGTAPDSRNPRPSLYVPSGTYLVSHIHITDFKYLHVYGDGPRNSVFNPSGNGPIFEWGTFTTTPANPWFGGETGDNRFENVGFIVPGEYAVTANVGSHTATAIKDNGAGGTVLRNVYFCGFKEGYYCPAGGDFCEFDNVWAHCCDVAVYFGPGGDQVTFIGGDLSICDRAIWLDGNIHAKFYNVAFGDNKTCDVEVSTDTDLYSGITTLGSWINQEKSITMYGCWHETGAGWDHDWPIDKFIYLRGETAGVKGVHIYNPTVMAGSTGCTDPDEGTPTCFVKMTKLAGAQSFCTITGAHVHGPRVDTLVFTRNDDGNWSYPKVAVRDTNGSAYYWGSSSRRLGGSVSTLGTGNPATVTTAANHGLTDQDRIFIRGISGETPSIDGCYTATVTGDATFTIPINVTVGGTGGYWWHWPAIWPWSTDCLEEDTAARTERRYITSLDHQYKVDGRTSSFRERWDYTDNGFALASSVDDGATWTEKAKIQLTSTGAGSAGLLLGDGSNYNKVVFGSAEPTSGTWRVGDIIINTGAAPSGKVGWVCTTAGTGGAGAVFKTFGDITA